MTEPAPRLGGPPVRGAAAQAFASPASSRRFQRCIELGVWGAVLGSNSAPHHPGWGAVEWQQRWNRRMLAGDANA